MKTNDTYMKFSWLTVTGVSMDKGHKGIIKHECNNGRIDQEILSPSINKGSGYRKRYNLLETFFPPKGILYLSVKY